MPCVACKTFATTISVMTEGFPDKFLRMTEVVALNFAVS